MTGAGATIRSLRRLGSVFRRPPSRSDFYALPSLGLFIVLYLRWQEPLFTFHEPLLPTVIVGLLTLGFLARFVPITAWVYWLAGVLTLLWSLAPGNTLIYGLWELLFLASLAAGRWRLGFWGVNVLLLGLGLFSALALNAFGLQSYLSGSIHYVTGAQALVVVPLALVFLFRVKSPWQRVGLALLLLASSYAASISGARAVYLPLMLIVVIGAIRLIWSGKKWYAVLGVLALLGLALVALDHVVPNQPMATALGKKATVAVQAEASSSYGVFTQRLRFWDQALGIALAHPFGAGTGSYQAVIHAFQKYPMLWSNSPHNVFVEAVATGGWLRLALLLALLAIPLWRGWRSKDWPYALSVGAIWMTMAFDVTSYYPSFMMLAFAALGPLYGSFERSARQGRSALLLTALPIISLIVATLMVLWWYLPCTGSTCATSRYLGVDYKVRPALAAATPAERTALLERARELYPQSLWVLREEQKYAETPEERLAIAREIATRFSYQHPQNYLDWANAALALDRTDEAVTAIEQGLSIFRDDEYPYGEMRVTPETYQAWLDTAHAMLRDLGR